MKLPKLNRFQILVHIASLLPLLSLILGYLQENLTANPIQAITIRTGRSALLMLILSLMCTPINTVFGFRQVLKIRRTLGLYAFMYAALHFLTFIGLDYRYDLDLILEAVFEKRYALVGFSAFLILFTLALTSTKGWMRRLGKNWKRLHRLVYLASLLVIVHNILAVKSDIRKPLFYGAVILLLMFARLPVLHRGVNNFRRGFAVKIKSRFDHAVNRLSIAKIIQRTRET